MEGNTTTSSGIVGQIAIKPRGKFQDMPCFDCPPDDFDNYKLGKKFKASWDSMLGKTEHGKALSQYVKDNNIKDFVVQSNGVMMNIRRNY